jgi:acyl-CoA reductase-like NAD-dependent aldehyde dehydrogenase
MDHLSGTSVDLLINGQAVPASGQRRFERRNPITGDVATVAAAAQVEDAHAAVEAAAAAFPEWSETGPNTRRALLLKAADALAGRANDFVASMAAETGATEGWARFNVMLASSMIREAASLTTQITGDVIPSDKPGCLAMAVRQPVGVILGIAPWNAPVILGVRAIATALACGNTVMLKASELCPRTQTLIGQAFTDAGFPKGVVNVISNAPDQAAEIVNALIDHPAVARINFTGSTRVGRIIAQRAAAQLKPVLLELGGKAPLLVLDDADLDEAVKAAAFGAFFNQGQICMSTERIVVDDAVADQFIAKFSAKGTALIAGDPREGKTPLGSIVDPSAATCIQALVDDAVNQGATLHQAGERVGTLMPAAILDHVTPKMRIYGEESFGPVVTIVRVKGEEEAIRVANDTEYGLSASVFTKDIARGLRIAKRIRSGICHINGATVHDEAQMPFGGVKASGYGRFGGKAGIDAFTELRWITIETLPGQFPI